MTGPIRCQKTGPGRPIPEHPPTVEVLPPTNPLEFVEPADLKEMRTYFNRGEFRSCVEPIERRFFARRNTFHQGLLQYVVALHQARLGLVRTPRWLLRQALDYWAPYPEWQEGIDLSALRKHAEALLAQLPTDVDQVTPVEAQIWWVPAPPLEGNRVERDTSKEETV